MIHRVTLAMLLAGVIATLMWRTAVDAHCPRAHGPLPHAVVPDAMAMALSRHHVVDPHETRTLLIVVAGQSNASGYGLLSHVPAVLSEHPRIGIFDGQGWRSLRDHRSNFGPELSFAHVLAQAYPRARIGIVKVAQPGTCLAKAWSPDNPDTHSLYHRLVQRTQDARASQADHVLLGVLWHQGETDARDRVAAANYALHLDAFIHRLRHDLGEPELPFLLGRINANPHRDLVRHAQQNIKLPHTRMIKSDDLPKYSDGVHYTSEGLLRLGRRYAVVMLDMLRPSTVRQDAPTPPSHDDA